MKQWINKYESSPVVATEILVVNGAEKAELTCIHGNSFYVRVCAIGEKSVKIDAANYVEARNYVEAKYA